MNETDQNALVTICQFLETADRCYRHITDNVLREMDLSNEAWDEALKVLHKMAIYTPGG